MVILRKLDEAGVIDKLCQIIEDTAQQSIDKYDVFTIGLSGGSLVKYLCEGLPQIKTDWSKWKLFFCDERVVPEDSEDSTFGTYKKNLLPNVPLNESQFVTIKQGVSAKEAAEDYTEKLQQVFGSASLPRFNMLLLGVGPDGHTCSLFPNHPQLKETKAIVTHIENSPKPPPCRVTLTYPVINNAENCVFAISGEGKADIIKRILKNKEDLPATKVQPTTGILYWIIDQASAKYIIDEQSSL